MFVAFHTPNSQTEKKPRNMFAIYFTQTYINKKWLMSITCSRLAVIQPPNVCSPKADLTEKHTNSLVILGIHSLEALTNYATL